MLRRILLPLDGSSDWESLIPHLRTFSDRAHSEVIVLEAVSFIETLLEMPSKLEGRDPGKARDIGFADTYVAAVVDLLQSYGVKARGLTNIGSEVATIARVARRERATLIALAVRERVGFPRTLFRTLAEQLFKASAIPIYAVPVRTTESQVSPPLPEGVVLVPVDGSGLSLQVLPFAAKFCRLFSARLLLVHIIPPGGDEGAAQRFFKTASAWATREGVTAQSHLGHGDPTEEILRICASQPVNLIAMRTRLAVGESRGPLGGLILRVLRAARVPMLIVRRAPRRKKEATAPDDASSELAT